MYRNFSYWNYRSFVGNRLMPATCPPSRALRRGGRAWNNGPPWRDLLGKCFFCITSKMEWMQLRHYKSGLGQGILWRSP